MRVNQEKAEEWTHWWERKLFIICPEGYCCIAGRSGLFFFSNFYLMLKFFLPKYKHLSKKKRAKLYEK